ncbi:lysyl oxidase homolog 2 [Microcaecilia unicolor]|uniref:Lysyl oxidase homolog n=1 Tax=Microcaecilia unicolor TaxID=1415580 RepID=A0A6P7XYM1_9AMPH|nr:lysyl oxidase homolog 2 [Microcaecilia unicolor]
MEGSLYSCIYVTTLLLLYTSLSHICFAQYEHWPYYPEYHEVQQEPPQPQRPPDIPKIYLRLSGEKRKHNEGRVEVYYNEEWGTVCDDDFSIHAAHVVCRELGYMEALSWFPSSKYGKGEGRIWLDNVNCNGKEETLAACTSNGWGISDCKHTEDVGVVCSGKRIPGFKLDKSLINHIEQLNIQIEDIRIRPVLSAHRKRIPVTEGYVEVKDEGSWKQICNIGWTPTDSRVVCGMFGFPNERKYNNRVYKMLSQRRKLKYWPYSVNCTGNEAHVSSCKLGDRIIVDMKRNQSCQHGMPVVVSCTPGRAFAPSSNTGFRKAFRLEQPLVRLKGGANIGEGRVEVLKNGEWGTICDDRWNLLSASVVCRELGFGSAKEALTGAKLGQGMGPIHMNEIQCSGLEKSITDCSFNIQSQGCNHEEDAAVRCNIPAMGFQNQVRLRGGRSPNEGRVEILMERNGTLRWGTVCSDGWGTVEAMIVCRQLGLGFASHAFQETWYWHGDVSADDVVLSGVKCSGTEMSLSHCRHHGTELNCPKGGGRFAAGVSCSETAPDLVLNAPLVEHTTYLEDRPMFLLQCALEENCLSSTAATTHPNTGYRRLLRFSSQIHNTGQSDFRPKNGRHAWVWHDCHRHYHSMEVFTHYDLLSLNGTKVAEGHKASFCLEDSECESDIQKQYACANFGEQGITLGCWDVYRHDIDCQWIDITDVAPGDYLFQVIINPNYEVAESDYSNNVMKCRSRYDGQRIWMYNCHIGGSLGTETEDKFSQFAGLLNNQLSL